MLKKEQTATSPKKPWKEENSEKRLKVIIPEQFYKKVRYLCNTMPHVEWSGHMFYSINGTIQDPENMEIILQDILPMDKGVATYTEYKSDTRFDEFIMNDLEERASWYVGHIHSHNNMNVYFSSTDHEELQDGSACNNIFLSVIVNNYMEIIAKLVTRGTLMGEMEAPVVALDEDGNKYIVSERDTVDVEREIMYIYECDLDIHSVTEDIDDEFKHNVAKLLREEKKMPHIKTVQKRPRFIERNTFNDFSEDNDDGYGLIDENEVKDSYFRGKNQLEY